MAGKSFGGNLGGWIFKAGMLRGMLSQGKLAWSLFKDERVPVMTKGIPLLAMLYIVSPIDALIDWIPVIGQLDDLAVIGLGLRAFIKAAPPELVEEHKLKLADSQSK
jgi:uncharacterized membrane protein YkvA (DUF1232 family)